ARRRPRTTRGEGSDAGTGGRETRRARGRSERSGRSVGRWRGAAASSAPVSSRIRSLVEPLQLFVERFPVLRTGRVREGLVLVRLALGDEGRASLRLTPRAHYYHRARMECTWSATAEPLFLAALRIIARRGSFKIKSDPCKSYTAGGAARRHGKLLPTLHPAHPT